MAPLSPTLITVYQDLLQAHLDRPPGEFEGTPHLRTVNGRRHWYATLRSAGGDHRQIFIGADNKEMRQRIARWQAASKDDKSFRASAAEKAAALRAARLPALDMTTGKVLRALAKAGTFRLGTVLVGTHAFRLYDAELGARIASRQLAVTGDIDIAGFEKLSVSIEDVVQPELPEVLAELGFAPAPSLDARRPTRWRMSGADLSLDILSPSFGPKEGPQKLEALGVWAQGLHFLNFLIRDPIPAVALYREGVLVQVPAPERYAVHKLIVAGRRTGPGKLKAEKDRAQARALIQLLAEHREEELVAAYAEARDGGPAWSAALDRALSIEPDLRRLLQSSG